MGDRIAVPLDLDDFEVVAAETVDDELVVDVESTFPPACFHCGSLDVIGHGRLTRRLRDRTCAYPTVLRWRQRRFRCRDCGRTSRERHPQVAGRRRITRRFLQALGEQACHQPWVEVAARERVSWWRVSTAFGELAATIESTTPAPARVISVDESAFRRRFRYHTVVSDPEGRRVLDLVEGRNQAAAENAFLRLPAAWRDQVETVVCDMHWPYRKAAAKILPQARVVADKFHVLRSIDAAAQRVRRRHGRRPLVRGRDGGISRQHNPRFHPRVFRSRWLFAKRLHQLDADDRQALDTLFAHHPQLGVAWWMKEAFAHIYHAPDRLEAERRLDVWVHNLAAADLPELTDTWRTVSQWREPILAYLDDPQTNAYAEGITNKIKVLKRRGYGYRNPDRYRSRVLLACGSPAR